MLRIDIKPATVGRRGMWGATWGALIGVTCSIVAFVQLSLNGLRRLSNPLALHDLVLICLVACTVAGAVVGLLLPLARSRIGSMVIGMLAILPIGAIVQYSTLHGAPWSFADIFVVIVGAMAIGVPAGAVYHELVSSSDASSHSGPTVVCANALTRSLAELREATGQQILGTQSRRLTVLRLVSLRRTRRRNRS
jgi:hypothetical protein